MRIVGNYKSVAIFVILLALGIIYFIFDPSASVFCPKCPVMLLTGFPCPGCGSQRALHALLHLNISEALRYNFLVVLFIPIILLMLFASFFRTRFPRLYYYTHNKFVAYTCLTVIVGWGILRIAFGWYV